MLVANSFDLWQKDTFFSAAEEVQQSADIMESAFRRWEREKREGLTSDDLGECGRELQTALGTAKWQLEEFEKAVRVSYRNRADDFTMTRHRQFVDAIENQISRVETALQESFSEQGKQPFRWVNLNEEECNDLAAFLCGTSGSSNTVKDQGTNLRETMDSSLEENSCNAKEETCIISTACNSDNPNSTKGSKDNIASLKDEKCTIDIVGTNIAGTRGEIHCQADKTSGTRRTWTSPDMGAWKIEIAKEAEWCNTSVPIIDVTPKDKGCKPVFCRQRSGDCCETKRRTLSCSQLRVKRWINQILGQVSGCQRHRQSSPHTKLRSVRVKFALMITIILLVPFVLYST